MLVQEHEQQQQWLRRVLRLWISRRLFCRKPIKLWRCMQPWSAHSKAKRLLLLPSRASQLRLAIDAWGAWVTLRLMRHLSKCHLQYEHVLSDAFVLFSYIAGAENTRQASVGPSRRLLAMLLVCTQKSCLHANGHSSRHDILTTIQAYMGQWKVTAWQAH